MLESDESYLSGKTKIKQKKLLWLCLNVKTNLSTRMSQKRHKIKLSFIHSSIMYQTT